MFFFDSNPFFQIDGAVMGSPLDPTLDNAFAQLNLKKRQQKISCPNNIEKKTAKERHNIFVMFHPGDHVKMFVHFMNTKHPNTCFIFEIEHQNSFSFLSIKNTRNTKKSYLKHKFIEKVQLVKFSQISKVLSL